MTVAAVAPLHGSTATANRAVNLPRVPVRSFRTIRPSLVATVTVTTTPGPNAAPRSWSGAFDTTVTTGPAAGGRDGDGRRAGDRRQHAEGHAGSMHPSGRAANDPNSLLTM